MIGELLQVGQRVSQQSVGSRLLYRIITGTLPRFSMIEATLNPLTLALKKQDQQQSLGVRIT